MTKRKTIITVVAAFIAVCAAGTLFLFLHMDVHAGLLMEGGHSLVSVSPGEGTSESTYTVTINGKTLSPGEEYLYDPSNEGDIVIRPGHGRMLSKVYLEDNEGELFVWAGDTACTQKDIDDELYDANIVREFTDPAIRDRFFSKNADGTVNYYGAMTLSQEFLLTDPYVGWSKGVPILFPDQKFSPQLHDYGSVKIIVETDYIPVSHVDFKELNVQSVLFEPQYTYREHLYNSVTALEEAVNHDIDSHVIVSDDIIRVGMGNEVIGVSAYSYPKYGAISSISGDSVQILIEGQHELTVFFVYPEGSKGIIIPIHVEPLDPDVPPGTIPTEEFFGTFVDSVTVTTESGNISHISFTYETLNEFLQELYTGTVVNLQFNLSVGGYIKSSSVGTVTDGHTIKGVQLSGPEPEWEDTGEGARVLAGTWTGKLVDGSDSDGPHYEFGSVEWNQKYTDGTQTNMELTVTNPPNPQVGLLPLKASTLDSDKTGIVVVAYVYTPQGVTLESGAEITISGSLESTTNPNEEEQEALKTLPEAIYDVDEEENYCGYWFSPDNGVDFKYFYSFTIKAVLTVGDVREEREITVEIEGSESSR